MANKKNPQEKLYIGHATDDELKMFVTLDILKKFPKAYRVKTQDDAQAFFQKHPNSKLPVAVIGDPERVKDKAIITARVWVRTIDRTQNRFNQDKRGLRIIEYTLTDYDCQNSYDGPREDCINMDYVNFMSNIMNDEYREKAFDYAEKTFNKDGSLVGG